MECLVIIAALFLFAVYTHAEKPQFDCPEAMTFDLYEEHVNVTCDVHSESELSEMSFSWKHRQSEDTMTIVGEGRVVHYRSQIINGDNPNDRIMVLNIGKVFPQHFRNHTFTATNADGTNYYTVEVIQDPDSVVDKDGAVNLGISLILYFMPLILWTIVV